jgi:hypothetical protein
VTLYSSSALGGSAAVIPVKDAAGRQAQLMPVVLVDAAGGTPEPQMLASNATLAAGATTAPVTGIAGAVYVWSYVLSGTTPQLVLEFQGPDGATWIPMATVTGNGAQNIVLSPNSTIRLRNGGANPITGLTARID